MNTRLTRRTWLRAAALGASLVVSGRWWVTLAQDTPRPIPVPPSVMLHARQDHYDNLADFIGWLRGEGFTPVTYQALYRALIGIAPLPAQPVILSIDDLVLVEHSNNFYFIEWMVDICIEKQTPVVLGINTEPLDVGVDGATIQLTDQDDALWETARQWSRYGVELATHTHSHRNLADASMRAEDYAYEIGGSAQMITDRTGQPVTTLILPYGNGIDEANVLLPPIVTACRDAGIGMVVAVAGGREPLIPADPADQPVYVAGRVGPYRDNFDSIYGEITYWQAQNEQLSVEPESLP